MRNNIHQSQAIRQHSLKKSANLIRTAEADDVLRFMKDALHDPLPTISWVQSDAGLGKTYLSEYVAEVSSKHLFEKTIKINFLPPAASQTHFAQKLASHIMVPDKKYIQLLSWDSFLLTAIPDQSLLYDCLCDIFGLQEKPSSAWDTMNGTSRLKISTRVLAKVFSNFYSLRGTLLFLEDLHWAQEDELQYIEAILEELKNTSKIQLLCTSRQNTPQALLSREVKIKKIMLVEFSEAQSIQLFEALDIMVPIKIIRKICHLSKGNPYFIAQYAHWLHDKKTQGMSYRELLELVNIYTPESITGILYAKLAHLDSSAVEIAKTAAIQGMQVDIDMLTFLSNISYAKILTSLASLEAAGVLHKTTDVEEQPIWVFRHELLQKVIYAKTPEPLRISHHRNIIRKLKQAHLKRDRNNTYQMMSYHAAFTGDVRLIYICNKRAAYEACKLSMHNSALQYLQTALRALSRLNGNFDAEKHGLRLRYAMLESLFISGQYSKTRKIINSLLKRKDLLTRYDLLDKTLSFQGVYFWVKGDLLRAKRNSIEILSLDNLQQTKKIQVRERARLSHICLDLGQHNESIYYASEGLKKLAGADPAKDGLLGEPASILLSDLSLAYAEIGDIPRSLSYFLRAEELLQNSNDFFTKVCCFTYLAHGRIMCAEYKHALSLIQLALICSDMAQANLLRPHILSAYGFVTAKLGDPPAGIEYCKQALRMANQGKIFVRLSLLNIWCAEAHMEHKQFSLAIPYLNDAVKAATQSREESRLAKAYSLLTECYQQVLPEGREFLLYQKLGKFLQRRTLAFG